MGGFPLLLFMLGFPLVCMCMRMCVYACTCHVFVGVRTCECMCVRMYVCMYERASAEKRMSASMACAGRVRFV